MTRKTNEQVDKILTKEVLSEHYYDLNMSIDHIADKFHISTKRVLKKINEYGFKRRRTSKTRRMDNADKIERLGFTLLEPYQGRDIPIKLLCYCGKEFTIKPTVILSGNNKSCGCVKKSFKPHYKGYFDISGKQFSTLKRGAIQRNLCFDITIKDIWDLYLKQDKKCALTNLQLSWTSKNGLGTASVDRIDNNKGYTIDNIQIIHKDVNIMKMQHSQDYIIYLCKLIANNEYNESNFLWWEKENLNPYFSDYVNKVKQAGSCPQYLNKILNN
jgi:hypothetical protein